MPSSMLPILSDNIIALENLTLLARAAGNREAEELYRSRLDTLR